MIRALAVATQLCLAWPGAQARADDQVALAPLLVNINTADRAELERLPGIGPAKAARILAQRQRLGGRFLRIADLRRVKGIGRKTVARLKPYLTLGTMPPLATR